MNTGSKRWLGFLLLGALAVGAPPLAAAEEALSPERIRAAARQADDLRFPAQPSSFSFFSRPQMAIYKPEGNGPFPAIVFMHQCGGLGNARWQNQSMLQWAKEAVARGYVAFLVDYMGPRDIDTVCYGPKKGLNFFRGASDAFQAAEHLRGFAFVDRERIGLAGYSWGAMVGLFAASRTVAAALSGGQRFRAVVSFYPGCFRVTPQAGAPYEVVQRDVDTPVLALLGDADTETPAAECVAKLGALSAAGAPVEWHVYPGATHCWDCRNLNGFSKVDVRGNNVLYRYDAAATEDSARRAFEFFDARMQIRR